MKWNGRTRCALLCLVFIALFSLFSFRLVYLQLLKHDEYAEIAAKSHGYKQKIYAERGDIFDANSEVLAHNVPIETVFADATLINKLDETIALVSARLKIPAEELSEKLRSNRPYIVLKREVPEAEACSLRDELRAKNLRGISLDRDSQRIYPNGSMLCHVIGFIDGEHHRGIQGVEMSMEDYLHGQDGYRCIERKPSGQEIVLYRGQEHAPRDGFDVHLTVDLNLQNIVENEIDAAMEEYHPLKATIILMRPQTGEILAMANRPNFDLNLRAKAKPEEMKNRAIIDLMEPGSTFKIVTAASALNEGKVRTRHHDFLRERRLELWRTHFARSQSVRRTDRARCAGEIEQHRRGQVGDECGRGKILRIHPPFWFWRSDRRRIAGRNPRHGPFAAIVEQDFHHANPDGTRDRSDTIANDGRDGGNRQWRQTRHAAHREIDHGQQRKNGEYFFAGCFATGNFAQDGHNDR